MNSASADARARVDELDLLAALVPLSGQRLIELGCGAAGLARRLLQRHPDARVTGLEVDQRQHAKNLAAPVSPGLRFVAAGAQAIPFADGSFDGALMLKSLHHVPLALMDTALAEVRRVLVPGGWLFVSEPVYAGPLNEIVRLFNDEGEVRAAAQAALDRAIAAGGWTQPAERRFEVPVHYADLADFEHRMVDVSFAERRLDDAQRAAVRARFEPHMGPHGAHFTRPMHLRLLRRTG